MRNPIRMAADFSRKHRVAAELLAQVRRNRPNGVDVSRKDPEFCAGLMLLLKKHPDLKVVKNEERLTLHYAYDADAVFANAQRQGTRFNEVFALPDEDLVHGALRDE